MSLWNVVGTSDVASALTASQVTNNIGNQVKSVELASVKTNGDNEIARRLASITDMQQRVSNAKYMSAAHKDTLAALLTADNSGLTNLKSKLDAETELSAVRDDVKSIFTQYRIYDIVEPKVHLVRAVDAVSNSATQLDDAATKLDSVVTQLKAAGKDTSAVEPLLVSAHSGAQAAASDVGGQADAAINLQPQDFPGNKDKRAAVLAAEKKGEADAKASLAALNQARSKIESLRK